MYILSSTRKNNSARSSQRGIRCGACLPGEDSIDDAGTGFVAGLMARCVEVDSGCWDILRVRTPSLIPAPSRAFGTGLSAGPAQGRRIATVTQQPHGPESEK